MHCWALGLNVDVESTQWERSVYACLSVWLGVVNAKKMMREGKGDEMGYIRGERKFLRGCERVTASGVIGEVGKLDLFMFIVWVNRPECFRHRIIPRVRGVLHHVYVFLGVH
jgi:hypothetical protein